ncbi:ankyrin repeat-containing domain protein [Tribonema minus]|uniref:Ankyrin repeat-containing domain protein n=1 Tax=Tribonema minus TaxID=303371 RepID=A0A835YTH2_9STRA|nr:ankyrin repeat-containing domain protein [Tribonema minus]
MPLDTELHKCANKGDLAGIRELIETDGADVNALGANDRTALHRAAGAGQLEVLQYLLKAGAALEALDRYSRTPLFWAAIGGQTQCLEELLAAGASPIVSTTTGTTAFMAAAGVNSLATVEALIGWVEVHPDKYEMRDLVGGVDNEGKGALQIAKEADPALAKAIKARAPDCFASPTRGLSVPNLGGVVGAGTGMLRRLVGWLRGLFAAAPPPGASATASGDAAATVGANDVAAAAAAAEPAAGASAAAAGGAGAAAADGVPADSKAAALGEGRGDAPPAAAAAAAQPAAAAAAAQSAKPAAPATVAADDKAGAVRAATEAAPPAEVNTARE